MYYNGVDCILSITVILVILKIGHMGFFFPPREWKSMVLKVNDTIDCGHLHIEPRQKADICSRNAEPNLSSMNPGKKTLLHLLLVVLHCKTDRDSPGENGKHVVSLRDSFVTILSGRDKVESSKAQTDASVGLC